VALKEVNMTEQQKRMKAFQWMGLLSMLGIGLLLGVYFSIELMF